MNTELNPQEQPPKKLTITLAHISSLVTFLLIAGVVAIGGAWCMSQGKQLSKQPRRSWHQQLADQHEARLIEIQDEINTTFEENMRDVSEWQSNLQEQNNWTPNQYDSEE